MDQELRELLHELLTELASAQVLLQERLSQFTAKLERLGAKQAALRP